MSRIILFAAILFLVGCKKDPIAKPIPVIVVTSPASNQHFAVGDIIHINGSVNHSKPLTEIAVHMTDLSTNMEFFHDHFSPTSQTYYYNFSSEYLVPSATKSSFQVEIEATDEDGNVGSKEFTILIN